MSGATHTQGRWVARGPAVVDERDTVIAEVFQTPGRPSADEAAANARLIAAAPELHDIADELFTIVAEERECYFESHRNQATGEIPDVCRPYLERLDAALNKARAAFAKATQP